MKILIILLLATSFTYANEVEDIIQNLNTAEQLQTQIDDKLIQLHQMKEALLNYKAWAELYNAMIDAQAEVEGINKEATKEAKKLKPIYKDTFYSTWA